MGIEFCVQLIMLLYLYYFRFENIVVVRHIPDYITYENASRAYIVFQGMIPGIIQSSDDNTNITYRQLDFSICKFIVIFNQSKSSYDIYFGIHIFILLLNKNILISYVFTIWPI